MDVEKAGCYAPSLRKIEEVFFIEGNSIWVEGVPATFATKGEKQWKNILLSSLTLVEKGNVNGLQLKFYLPTLAPNGHPLDIDNLCEPVFSTMIGRLGWFQGRRPNIQWWCASKEKAERTGLRIVFEDTALDKWTSEYGQLVFDQLYNGDLPMKATGHKMPIWIKNFKPLKFKQNDRFALRLLFGRCKLNIAEIADGRVKNLIDCLYPIIGGRSGAPEDWRIDSIFVQKGVPNLPQNAVRISIYRNCDKRITTHSAQGAQQGESP